jgi:ribosomal protein S18 acetylase RimI-like enzyme
MAAELRGGRAAAIGIRDGGELVAVVLVTHDGRKGFVNRLAVRPSHRRHGLARRLLAHAEEHLRRLGLPLASALVEEGNAASLALFREAGYTLRRDILYLRKPLGDDGW